MYGAAYWYPLLFWWSSCVSILPLLTLKGSWRNYFWYGICWSLISYSLHLWGVITGIVSLAAYSTWYAWVPGILLVVYITLFTGCMWAVGAWCIQKIRIPTNTLVHYFFWGMWFALYWHLITYYILLPLGRCEGYLLLNPIIPLATHPMMLIPVSYVGVSGYTLLYCCVASVCMYVLLHASYRAKIILLLSCFFLINGIVFVGKVAHVVPDTWHTRVIGIPKSIGPTDDLDPACRLLCDYVSAAVRTQDAIGVVFPESSLYTWRICAESRLAAFIPARGTQVQDYIIGSFYDDCGKYRNSCYWLRWGVLQKRFDKRHAMPLIERVPWLLQCSLVQRLFFTYMPEIVPSDNERPYMMCGNVAIVPYICSELFFNKYPDDVYADMPILALVNDRWCTYEYMQHLMYLGAVVQAYAWHRDIMYVSYSRCLYISNLTCA